MSAAELQSCLARLYVDDSFRQLFFLNPAQMLQQYCLSSEENASILALDRQMLELFANSLRTKRREALARAYPLLFGLNRDMINRYYDRYYQLFTASPYHTAVEEAAQFGMFMEESLAYAPQAPPWASELARYERLSYVAQFTSASHQQQAAVITEDCRPVLMRGVEISTFCYDVTAFEEMLRTSSDATGTLAPGEHVIVFGPASKMLRLNPASRTLLELADGRQSVASIVNAVEAQFGTTNLREVVLESFARFQAAAIIWIA